MNKELKMHAVFLSLGSNIGDRQDNLDKAISNIEERIGIIPAKSSVIETEPWGFDSENHFLNMVIKVETRLLPKQVLFISQAIERELGRTNKTQGSYQDRIIDIDIILYDDLHLKLDSPELTIPHPHFKERDFVMKPLLEIKN